ncbi:Type 4 prepilin-like proteins leader peptide-processing enzyme [Candidatus Entotheonellaceae bacterium PAL068K]
MQPLQTFDLVVIFVMGCLVGSFANVCIHRLPWRQSLVFPGSHCPHCQQAIRPWHNVPLLSYVWLGGRCAYCQMRISWRYPLVELLCGLLYVFVSYQLGLSVQSVVLMLLTTVLLIVSCIDLAHQVIPDALTLPGIIVGLLVSSLLTPVGLLNAVAGVGLGWGLFLMISILSRGGMGGGDIKLIAMIGAFLGWHAVLITTLLGALLGTLIGIALMILRKKGRKDPLPFGPFLALGALVTMVWEHDLLRWYAHFPS